MKRKIALIAIILGLLAAAIAFFMFVPLSGSSKKQQGEVPALHEFTLSNGVRVIVVPNHRVPAVSHTLWLSIGAADDPIGKSGLAHYLEHLMFKGTPEVPDGEYSQVIERLGGNHNAFTGADFTGYYVNIAKEHLETVMKMEADRFQYLTPSKDAYAKERDVIIEERKSRVDNKPRALLAEQVSTLLFQHHPYRIPIIGWEHEMAALSAQDAENFYRRYYHPGNMILVVAGDVTPEQLRPLAEKYYGRIPAKAAAKRDWVGEPPARGVKQIEFAHPLVRQVQWSRHYLAPSMVYGESQHAMPLMLFDQWLGGGKTSVLYRELVEKQKLASHVGTSYSGLTRGPSRFAISVVPKPGVSLDAVESAVEALLKQTASTLIDEETLLRAKTLFKADAVYARDGLQPVAQFVGYLASLGLDTSLYTQWTEKVDAVTPEQIQNAAQMVLGDSYVTAVLLPKEKTAEKEVSDAPNTP